VTCASPEELGPKARRAGEAAAELAAAVAAERDAEAELLTEAIEAARTGLRAICGRRRVRDATWTTQEGTVPHAEHEDYSQPARRLVGAETALEDSSRASGGRYEGNALWILVDGTLAEVTYYGQWTRWQGGRSEWQAKVEIVTPREAMNNWELADVVEALSQALDGALKGKADVRTKAALARAAKLRAITELLKQ
jgi:hypothetical protein